MRPCVIGTFFFVAGGRAGAVLSVRGPCRLRATKNPSSPGVTKGLRAFACVGEDALADYEEAGHNREGRTARAALSNPPGDRRARLRKDADLGRRQSPTGRATTADVTMDAWRRIARAVFRLPAAAVLLPVLVVLCVTPLATAGGAWAALFVVPVVALAYVLYTRTVADPPGVTVHTPARSPHDGVGGHGPAWSSTAPGGRSRSGSTAVGCGCRWCDPVTCRG